MKIAIQTIIFNGEKHLPDKMLLAWLEQANNIADYVFITEGATKAINHYWDGDTSEFTVDGKSTDNTCSIIKEYINESSEFFLKFGKYNNYLNFKNNDNIDISIKPNCKWIFEKIEYQDKEFIYLKRELKNNKFYYTNIEYGDIYTNYYLGWGIDGLLW